MRIMLLGLLSLILTFLLTSCSYNSPKTSSIEREKSFTNPEAFGLAPDIVNVARGCVDSPTISNFLEFYSKDQALRTKLHSDHSKENIHNVRQAMHEVDSTNRVFLNCLLRTVGWPSEKIYGSDAENAAYILFLHTDNQFRKQHLQVIDSAFSRNLIKPIHYAVIIDRILIYDHKKQRYGTHGSVDAKNKISLLPSENDHDLNNRRLSIGLNAVVTNKCEITIVR